MYKRFEYFGLDWSSFTAIIQPVEAVKSFFAVHVPRPELWAIGSV